MHGSMSAAGGNQASRQARAAPAPPADPTATVTPPRCSWHAQSRSLVPSSRFPTRLTGRCRFTPNVLDDHASPMTVSAGTLTAWEAGEQGPPRERAYAEGADEAEADVESV
jgi:hypothetical protein